MKKNTVITSIVLLLCLVLFGMDLSGVMAEEQVRSRSNIIGSMEKPVPVTFSEDAKRTTLYINIGTSFGNELPSLPDETWQWVNTDGNVLDGKTIVEAAMTVYASQRLQGNDFLKGVSAALYATSSEKPFIEGALIASQRNNTQLNACLTADPNCHPSVWSFEFAGCTEEADICKYYVSSGGSYLNVSSTDAWLTTAKPADPLYIKDNGGTYRFLNSAKNGALNFKKDTKADPTGGTYYFKGTKSDYFGDPGSQIYFAPKMNTDSTLTLAYSVNGGNILPGPASLKITAGTQVKLPEYTGTKNSRSFSGWSTTTDGDVSYYAGDEYTMPEVDTILYAVYDNNSPILWLDINGGVGTLENYFFTDTERPVILPGADNFSRGGYEFVGWSEDKDAIFTEDGIIQAGTSYDIPGSGDTILYAVWHKISTVTFVTSHVGQQSFLIDIDKHPSVYLNNDCTYVDKEGNLHEDPDFDFYPPKDISKWMYFDDGGNKVEIDVDTAPLFTVPSYDVILFEVKDPDQEITVKFDPNGGVIDGNTEPYEYTAHGGEDFVLNTLGVSRESYELVGWEDVFGNLYPANGLFPCRIDETLKAVWGYTVNFDARGGNGGSPSVNCILGQECTFPDYSGTRNGNAFLGWIMDETYDKGDTLYPESDGQLLEEDGKARAFQYYAQYNVTIRFDTTGGGNVFDLDQDGKQVSNKEITNQMPWNSIDLLRYTPVKDPVDLSNSTTQIGKREFLGWAVSKDAGKDQIIRTYEVTGALDQTLYAIWGSRFFYYMRGENGSEDVEIARPSEPGLEGDPVTLTLDVDNLDTANFKGWTDGTKQYKLPDLTTTYRRTNTKLYAIWHKDVQIVFNKNSQNNDVKGTAPESIPAKIGDEITIPGDNGLTKSGFIFLGWTDGSNLLDSSYHRIYKEGEKYVIPMTSGDKITFYAAWTPNGEADGVAKDQVRFGIRLDGTIPKEPGSYEASDYTSRKGIKLGNVFYSDNQVTERKWVADNDPNPENLNTDSDEDGVSQYYIVNSVTNAVTMVPKASDITFIMNNNGKEFDPSKQYVLWYVLKWQGKSGNDYIWHVDGVVLNKDMATLVYDYNCDPVKKVDNMPRGFQVAMNTDVVVGDNGGVNKHDTWMVPDRVDEAGIHFKGWSLVQNPGPGDKIYTAADPIEARSIKLTQPVTTLYAQWETSYVDVEFYKNWENDTDPLVQSMMPKSILLTLTGRRTEDDSVYKTHYFSVTPNSKDVNGQGWYVKATDLPAFDTAGKALAWDWSEEVPHFRESERTRVSSSNGSGTTITITNQLVTTSTVIKEWDDENDNDGKRPESVTVQLYEYTDDKESKMPVGDPVTLTGDTNTWTYTAEDLPVFDGDKIITYTWDETDVPEGYNKTVGEPEGDSANGWSTGITNKHDPETASLKVVMIWDDRGAEVPRPNSVALTLTGTIPGTGGSGEVIVYGPEALTVNAPASGDSDNDEIVYQWKEYTTEPLKVYNSGQPVTYIWSETVPDKYDHNAAADVVTDSDDNTKTTITNHRYVVRVKPNPGSKEYGSKDPQLDAAVDGLKSGDTVTYTLTREKGENVGRSVGGQKRAGSRVYKIEKHTGDVEQGYYHVIYEEGDFTITPATLIITAENKEKVYGDPDPAFSVKVTGMKNNDLPSQLVVPLIERKGSDEAVGTYPGVIVPSGPSAIENYDIKYVNGNFTITPAKVTVKAQNKYKIYGEDDTVATAELSAEVSGLKNQGDTIDYQLRRETGEKVLRSLNDLKADGTYPEGATGAYTIYAEPGGQYNKITEDGIDYYDQGNYYVRYINGEFVIKPRDLTIIGNTCDNLPYTGEEQQCPGYTLSSGSLLGTDEIDPVIGVKLSGKLTNVGMIDNKPLVNTFEEQNNIRIMSSTLGDVTICYNIVPKPGSIIIKPVDLIIRSDNGWKLFDGTPLTQQTWNSSEGLKGNDKIQSVTITGSQTEVGDSENTILEDAVIVTGNGDAYRDRKPVNDNYTIKYEAGTLVVAVKPVLIIRAKSAEKIYDGTELKTAIDAFDVEGLREGDVLSGISVEGSRTIVGTSDNKVIGTVIIKNAADEDVTSDYDILPFENGSLKVTKRPLTLTAATAIKQVYDGTWLRDPAYTYDEKALAPNETLSADSVVVEGSRLQAGTTPNKISGGMIVDAGGNDVTDNYNISHIDGLLTINPRPVTVTVGAYSKSRGELDPEFIAAVINTVNGETVRYVIAREEGEEEGQYAVTPSGDKFQGSYLVTYIPGTLTINYNAEAFTVVKVWDDDNNRDGIRPVSLGVSLIGSNGTFVNRRLSAENNWSVTVSDMPVSENGVPVTYRWTEDLDTDSYEQLEPEVRSNTTILRNRHAIARTSSTVTKIWDDKDNRGGTRPVSLRVVLRGNGRNVTGAVLNETNGWSETVGNLPMYENGRPVEYIWYEQSVGGGYYAVSSVTSGSTTTLVNSNLYKLTIHYRYNSGLEARPDHTDTLYSGETFSVVSPEIENYTASMSSVAGQIGTNDLEFTVVYTTGGEAIIRRDQNPDPGKTVAEHKVVPAPRDTEPDADHPLVLSIPNILVDIDDLNTALGLGEVNSSNHGFALE